MEIEEIIRFQPSQFLYTLQDYLANCKCIKGNAGDGNDGDEALITLKKNCGRSFIPFCPAAPVSIAATEALGRPFVEITMDHFCQFYEYTPDSYQVKHFPVIDY